MGKAWINLLNRFIGKGGSISKAENGWFILFSELIKRNCYIRIFLFDDIKSYFFFRKDLIFVKKIFNRQLFS